MYLDKVPLIHGEPPVTMPVRTAGDLPMDKAQDHFMEGGSVMKRNSTPLSFKSDSSNKKRRPERSHSICSYSDSDSDVELDNYFKFLRSSTPGSSDSRRDAASSPEEVTVYHDHLSRKALQENAQVRNPRRIASPHRNPLHMTQDQARQVCSPRSHATAFQKRTIHDRDSSELEKPKRFKQSGNAYRRLDLSDRGINKAHHHHHHHQKPMKRKSPPPTAAFSSDSDGLPAVRWTPKKAKVKTEENTHRSAFSTPHRTHAEALGAEGPRAKSIKSEEGLYRSSPGHRSAFQFLQSFSNSETSSGGEERTVKRTLSTPSELGVIHREKWKSEASRPSTISRANSTPTPTTTDNNNSVKAEHRIIFSSPVSSPAPVKAEEAQKDYSELYLAGVPSHIKHPIMCNKEPDDSPLPPAAEESNMLPFGSLLHTLLEGCQEEGHHNDAVDFIHNFTNVRRRPPEECLDYIKDLLMKVDSEDLLVNSYTTLSHVQHLHLQTRETFEVEWKLLRTLMSDILAKDVNDSNLLQIQGNMLVLKFITGVFGEDLETRSKDNQLKKSYIHNLLSADTCSSNVRHLIEWICTCVERIQEAEDRLVDNAPVLEQDTCNANTAAPSGHLESTPSQSRLSVLLTVLQLLQKLLHMCLVVSPNLAQSAEKIADEFWYCYQRLPKYCHKKRVLQVSKIFVRFVELVICYQYHVR